MRLTQTVTCLLAIGVIVGSSGCARSPYAGPNGLPPATGGNPWNSPPTVVAPPPAFSGVPAPGGALPAVPALPPTTSNPALPGVAGGGFGGTAAPNSVAPSWSNPGTIQQQQDRATRFDPYADNNAGPEIVGGRPREFQKPLAEPVRARGFRDTRWPF